MSALVLSIWQIRSSKLSLPSLILECPLAIAFGDVSRELEGDRGRLTDISKLGPMFVFIITLGRGTRAVSAARSRAWLLGLTLKYIGGAIILPIGVARLDKSSFSHVSEY